MYQLIYVSSATAPLTKEALITLLTHSRARNEAAGISGLLLYKGGNIMQVIEGEETTVKSLYQRIECDPRHYGHIVLVQGPIGQRNFPDWTMGFRDLGDDSVRALPGFSEFLNTPLTQSVGSRAERLLHVFRTRM